MFILFNKFFGYDKIFIKVYKDCLFLIFLLIIDFINILFLSSVFFIVWKIVEVVLIFKIDDYELVNNNCLILLLFVLLKVCE